MFTAGHPHDRRPDYLGQYTRYEETAIRQARDYLPHESQRGLAKKLYRREPWLRHQGRVLGRRSLQSIYNAIRRVDRQRKASQADEQPAKPKQAARLRPNREPAAKAAV